MQLIRQKIPFPAAESLAYAVSLSPYSCWLDSALPEHPRGHYSFFVHSPLAVLQVSSGRRGLLQSAEIHRFVEQPYRFLEEWLRSFAQDLQTPENFCGGVVGLLTYESYGSRLKQKPHFRHSALSEAFFILVDSGIIIDERKKNAWVF